MPQRHTIDNETNIECLELVRLAYSSTKLGLQRSLTKEEKRAALEALESVGATELAHKSLGSLSGGELQTGVPCGGPGEQAGDAAA